MTIRSYFLIVIGHIKRGGEIRRLKFEMTRDRHLTPVVEQHVSRR